MSRINMKLACVFLLLSAMTAIANATSHVFVRNEQGVWLASDSLVIHRDGMRVTRSKQCKVSITRGRVFFNAGSFKNMKLLLYQESDLTLDSFENTTPTVLELLKNNRSDFRDDPHYSQNRSVVVNTGILQVKNSVFRAEMIGWTDSLAVSRNPILDFKVGIPHGFGESVDRVRDAAAKDPKLAARIASHPKEELLKILKEESIMHRATVGEPFTVFLLHIDGTVSDFSDQKVCEIPDNAQHSESSNKTSNDVKTDRHR